MVAEEYTEMSRRIVDMVPEWAENPGEGVCMESAERRVERLPVRSEPVPVTHPTASARKVLAQLQESLDRLALASREDEELFDVTVRFCNQSRSSAMLLFVLRAWLAEFRNEWIDEYVQLSRRGAALIAEAVDAPSAKLSPEQRKRSKGYSSNILSRAERLEKPSSDWGIVVSTFRPMRTERYRYRTDQELREEMDELMRDESRATELRSLAREFLLRGLFDDVGHWLSLESRPANHALQVSIGHIAPFLFGTRHPERRKEQPSLPHFGLLVAAMELGNLTRELLGEKGPLKLAFRSLISEVAHLAERLEIMAEGSREQFSLSIATQLTDLADRVRATIGAPLSHWQLKHESHPSLTPQARQLEQQALESIRGNIAAAAEFLSQSALYSAVTRRTLEHIVVEYDATAEPIEDGDEKTAVHLERLLPNGEARALVGSYRLDDLEQAGIHPSHDGPIYFRCQVVSREVLQGGGQHIVLLPAREQKLSEQRRQEIRREVEDALEEGW